MVIKKFSFYILSLFLATSPLIADPSLKTKTTSQKKKKFVAPDTEIKTLENSPFKDVAHEYLKGFKAPEKDDDDTQQKKFRAEIPQLSEYDLFTHIFNLYQTLDLTPPLILNRNGWKDLEMLCGEHTDHINLVYFLNRTQTKLGQSYLGYLLTHPISDVATLQNRQHVVKEFVSNPTLSTTFRKALADVARVENNLFFFWETESEFNMKAISSFYFTSNLPGLKNLKKVNTNPRVMEVLCFKGRLYSYSLPALLPALSMWLTKKTHYTAKSLAPYNTLQQTPEYKALEKKFETIFAKATPEEKKALLETLHKNKWFHMSNIGDFVAPSTSNTIEIDGKSYSYKKAAEKVGHYEAQKRFNDRYKKHSPFTPQRQAHSAAQAATSPWGTPLPFTGSEQETFKHAFKKSFGTFPEEHDKVLSLWKPIDQELHAKSRSYAFKAFINNNNPFVSELKNVKSLGEIKAFDINNFDLNSLKASLSKFFNEFDFFGSYTFGDKRKFFSLLDDYIKTKPFGIDQQTMDYATMGVNGVSKAHLYFAGVWYAIEALTMFEAYQREKSYNELTNYIHAQMMTVGTVVRAMKLLSSEIKKNPILKNGLDHQHHLTSLFDAKSKNVSKKMHQLISLLLTNTFTGTPSYFCFKGRVLATYALMKEIKNELAPALLALGEIDACLSAATLYKEYEGKENSFCFATYLQQETPYIKFDEMWNPFIPAEKAIANSLELGGEKPLNVILTGPNAGGKSTCSKGLTLNVLLAQTLTVVPAKSLIITPFEKINTYMNITDDTAGGTSLFKSEVLRAQSLLKTIGELDKKKFSFSIMDEIFSGTSPREGEAAGYAVAKNIGSNTNSIAIIATHFPKLKELEKTTDRFKNYQVRVAYAPDGSFTYPFKLEEGAADQNVAVAILQQQGFESSILDEAQALLAVPTTAKA